MLFSAIEVPSADKWHFACFEATTIEAEQRHTDLLVLGKHGRSHREELLVGSVTKHLLAEGSSDVRVSTASEP